MAKKNILDKITISVPRKKMEENPAQWVASLGEKRVDPSSTSLPRRSLSISIAR